MKHRWVVLLFAVVFTLSAAAGIYLRVSRDRAPELPISATVPETTLPETDPNSPLFTVNPPATEPATELTSEPEPPVTDPLPDENTDIDVSADDYPPDPDTGDGLVHICIGGDTSIDGEFYDFAKSRSADYPWEEISDIMRAADISIVNLETCVSERGVSEKREGYGFRTPPEMLEGFKNAGIDAVNLANNHTRDFGTDALLDTFTNLSGYGIEYFGAGRDIDEATDLTIIERDGIKFGFVGANKVYLSPDCTAAEEHPGINCIGESDSESANDFIERLYDYDALCDVLIVFLHAGTEETFTVSDYQKTMSRKFIDAGADIVVGGHSHTLQPIEFYSGKPIIYSIGNLIFWHIDDDIDGLSAVFDITADKSGFKELRLHPVFIKNYKANLVLEDQGSYPTRYRQIIDLMNENCRTTGVWFDDSGVMHEGENPQNAE